jgi:hypothetical protein
MSLDTSDVQGVIRKIESDMRRLQADVEQLRRTVDATEAEQRAPTAGALSEIGVTLPSEIVIQKPSEAVNYLRAHPDLMDVVEAMATALVEEFKEERHEIELVVYQDPEIEDRQLTFFVRVMDYDDAFGSRMNAVWESVDRRHAPTPDWILVTTDFRPVQ